MSIIGTRPPLISETNLYELHHETLTGWGLDPEKTYSFKGEYLEEQKMVVFCLKTMNL